MNDDSRKLLTEFIGECWHKIIVVDGIRQCSCGIVGNLATSFACPGNRTFTEPADTHAVKDALVKAGKWEKFLLYCTFSFPSPSDLAEFIAWLFSADENGDQRLCVLAVEYVSLLSKRTAKWKYAS